MSNIPRKHHYVWRYYLRGWATDEKIWCCREGKLFRSNLMGVAQQRDFYKLLKLTKEEREFLSQMISSQSTPNFLKQINAKWIFLLEQIFIVQEKLNHCGISNNDINAEIEALIITSEEKYHSEIEGKSEPYINELRKKNSAFYSTEDGAMMFIYYICVQYFRTLKLHRDICSIHVKNNPNINTEHIWPILRHILATNMAYSLYSQRDKYHLFLMDAPSGCAFIAGDQPVVNTDTTTPATRLELYYPLSPQLALLITENKNIRECLQPDEVEAYNRLIVNSSYEQIYAAEESDLIKYRKNTTTQAR